MPAFMVKLRERREDGDVHVRACDAMEMGETLWNWRVGRRAAAFGS